MTDLEKIQDQLEKAMSELKELSYDETQLAYDYIEYANILVKNLILHGVVNCKTPKQVLVLGCGDTGKTTALKLAKEGIETIVINDAENIPLGLKDYRLPDVEPMVIKEAHLNSHLFKPQNRSERRKQTRTNRKKKKR